MSAEQRTLEELEGVEWGEPPFGSHLVTEALRTEGPGERDSDVVRRLHAWGNELGTAPLPGDPPGGAPPDPAC
jgi:hypothetical protein